MIPYLQLAVADREKVIGPSTDDRGTLTEPRAFNLMFKTFVGALESESNVAYLRPETAQGIFANFKNVVDTGRVKLPFGIAQIGKSFRNEINPRNFTFRSREFEQMEIEFFCRPEEATEWYAYWRQDAVPVVRRPRPAVGPAPAARPRPRGAGVLLDGDGRHRVRFPFGISELEGIAHRGDYDLSQHMKFSGKDLSYFDEETQGAVRAPCRRAVGRRRPRDPGVPLRGVHRRRSRRRGAHGAEVPPADRAGQGGVFPLVKRDGMPEKAEAIYRELKRHYNVFYDEKGAIGRRYRRQDEAGTPFCITVDSQTLTDDTVTFRDRDSCRQWRVAAAGVVQALGDLLEGQADPGRLLKRSAGP